MKSILKYLLIAFVILIAACCTIKKAEGESEESFIIRQCLDSAKKSKDYSSCDKLIEAYVKKSDDERLYKRYEYCKENRDDSQKFSECWLNLNQR